MKKLIVFFSFLVVTMCCSSVKAQVPSGYVKVASVPVVTTTFIDTNVSRGSTYQYILTAQNSTSESAPSVVVIGAIPASGPTAPSATISWSAGAGGGAVANFNVYRFLVVPLAAPATPVGLGVVVK